MINDCESDVVYSVVYRCYVDVCHAFLIKQNILFTEWNTIDKAVHTVDFDNMSTELVDKMNRHNYLKFPSQSFNCSTNGTITLPVSARTIFADFRHVC